MSIQADRGALYADRIRKAFHAIFEDPENRFYFEGPDADTGYMLDTGNTDARTEGMSYGMMMAVQMTGRTSLTGCGPSPSATCG